MLKLSRMGAVIFPPVPAFYHHPQSIESIVEQTAMRVLDQFGIHLPSRNRWDGEMSVQEMPSEKDLQKMK
jgi:4-hydroxy-3-polyprenylbenzoate decarboxylase